MARAANQGTVSADMKPTDYRGAVQRLKAIDGKKSKQQEIAKSIGDIYSACEAMCGVNKLAAQMFMKFRKLEEAEQITVFRDLNGLMDADGMAAAGADLVDKAEGKNVRMRLAVDNGKHKPEAGEDEGDEDDAGTIDEEVDVGDDEEARDAAGLPPADEDGDGFQEATDEELAQQRGRAEAEAKRRAKEVLGEPYTGDNSDLADSGDE